MENSLGSFKRASHSYSESVLYVNTSRVTINMWKRSQVARWDLDRIRALPACCINLRCLCTVDFGSSWCGVAMPFLAIKILLFPLRVDNCRRPVGRCIVENALCIRHKKLEAAVSSVAVYRGPAGGVLHAFSTLTHPARSTSTSLLKQQLVQLVTRRTPRKDRDWWNCDL